MVRFFFMFSISALLFTSCDTSKMSLSSRIASLSLGMSKDTVFRRLERTIDFGYAARMPEGDIETYHLRTFSNPYTFTFINGALSEILKGEYETTEQKQEHNSCNATPVPPPPPPPPPRSVFGYYYVTLGEDYAGNTILDDQQGNRIKIRKNRYDSYDVDNGIEKFSIKRDIFGHLNYIGSRGRRAYFKKNIYDTRIYTDNKGNEDVYIKEYWHEILAKYGNEDLLFITLINRFLY